MSDAHDDGLHAEATRSTSLSTRIATRLERIEAEGLLRQQRVVEPLAAGRCRLAQRELWDFSNNDYLGMSRHPAVIDATQSAVARYGAGARASMLISGWTVEHERLSLALARFEKAERALLFSSGYAACMGTVSTLVEPGDTIYCDKLNHACLVDGCRLSGARLRVYRYDDLSTLERELQKPRGFDTRTWIVTETVFGMEGMPAPLPELLDLAERYDACLICDEAHATGVFGPGGQGQLAEVGEEHPELRPVLARRIAARIGTLSKALGAQGGFVVGSRELISLLWNAARPAMFATGLAIANCAAATAALNLLEQHPDQCTRLRQKSRTLRVRLREAGLQLLGADECPIIPLVLADPLRTLEMGRELEQAGFLVGAVRPPTVPRNTSRLRISLSLSHPDQAIEELAARLIRLQRGEHT